MNNNFSLNKIINVFSTLVTISTDILRLIGGLFHTRAALMAENIFLRKQLAMYKERKHKPHMADNATRYVMVLMSKLFDWKNALIIVQPDTFIKWHRKGFKLFWRYKCQNGRPSLPKNIRLLIKQMTVDNPLWGEERIANELLLKLGIQVSPRTVRKYMPKSDNGDSNKQSGQTWSTFIHNHMDQIIACDFMTVVTVSFRVYYVFVVIELGTRKIIHYNITQHPNEQWVTQQFREAIHPDNTYKYQIHDRDAIFSKVIDRSMKNMGIKDLKSAVRAPKMNAFCERVIGTIRRKCTDHVLPFTENHLRSILKQWMSHYNTDRPHMSLGPGIPHAPPSVIMPLSGYRHQLPGN